MALSAYNWFGQLTYLGSSSLLVGLENEFWLLCLIVRDPLMEMIDKLSLSGLIPFGNTDEEDHTSTT